MIDVSSRDVACFAIAAALVVAGTLGTGLFPPGVAFQVLAGALVVAGFGLVFACLATS